VADDRTVAGPGDTALAERYEQLRQAALASGREGWQQGLGLLMTRGMVAWMRAWTEGLPQTSAAATVAPQPIAARAGELVAVLAQMAMAHARAQVP
jgi:hypothetical protein